MIFVPYYKLQEGMKVANDISLKDTEKSKAFLLKEGAILTKDNILKLSNFNISGVYIDDGRTNPILDEKLRKESVRAVKEIFNLCENTQTILNENTLKQIESISEKLVDNIYSDKQISVSISDLQTYDLNTYLHSVSVTVISIAIGTALSLTKMELCKLGVCALLHDIGKIEIPIEIINKPSKLTKEEFEIVKTHAQLGGNFVMDHKCVSDDIYMGIISHHEKYNGTGYPHALKKEEIPLFGRIIAVADVYDALTGNRPYRNPIKPLEAIEYIMAGVGSSFDYNIVKAFLRKIEPYPVGSYVKLSDKRCARVIGVNKDSPLRPIIKIADRSSKIIDLKNDADSRNIVIIDIDYSYLIVDNQEKCV